ncbi:MAG TPA: hypothetical protein ENI41_08165 [Deltaproteobacteria bacterium]|nr:hypothetical protein [Deltaproteobacteria bacterium]
MRRIPCKLRRLAILVYWLVLCFYGQPHAGAPLHGAKAASMGTAFVAVADDPSAIVHNPAGIATMEGTHTYNGVTAIFPTTKYTSTGGESERTKFRVFFPPHLYLCSDMKTEKVSFGLGVFSPFGVGGRYWDKNSPTRFVSIKSTIASVAINPVFAIKATPDLSIGIGFFYLHSLNTAERRVDQSIFGADTAKFSLEADGGGWGYNLGFLWKPRENLSFGIAYRSHIKVHQSGEAKLKYIATPLQPFFGGRKFETDIDTDVDFPDLLNFGVAYLPVQNVTLSIEAEFGNWSRFDKQEIDFDKEIPAAGFTDCTIDLDWEDAWILKFGIEYRLKDSLAFRAGYVFVETPVPDRTLSPCNPDSKQHNFTIGMGYSSGKWTLDWFYCASFFKDRKVKNETLTGEYENFIHYLGLSVGYRF